MPHWVIIALQIKTLICGFFWVGFFTSWLIQYIEVFRVILLSSCQLDHASESWTMIDTMTLTTRAIWILMHSNCSVTIIMHYIQFVTNIMKISLHRSLSFGGKSYKIPREIHQYNNWSFWSIWFVPNSLVFLKVGRTYSYHIQANWLIFFLTWKVKTYNRGCQSFHAWLTIIVFATHFKPWPILIHVLLTPGHCCHSQY